MDPLTHPTPPAPNLPCPPPHPTPTDLAHKQCRQRCSELASLPPPLPCPSPLQSSYMVLDQGVSAVTFSVGNTMKRIAVVVSSVMFFRNPVSLMNWLGSAIAILGTYLYSLATEHHAAEQKKLKQAQQAS